MIKAIVTGAALAVFCGAPAAMAAVGAPLSTWLISPDEAGCRADVELVGGAGPPVMIALVSDGQRIDLRFTKDSVPERAFLPIRVDQKPYSNLTRRTADPRVGEMALSEETLAALRRGRVLQIAWLTGEVVGASLAGSEQAILDLRICGAQVAGELRERQAAEAAERERAAAEAHAQALAQAELQAAQAQAAAAEAESQRQLAAAEAERQRLAEIDRQARLADQRAYLQAERERAYDEARRRQAYDDRDDAYYRPAPQYFPPRPVYGYRAPY